MEINGLVCGVFREKQLGHARLISSMGKGLFSV